MSSYQKNKLEVKNVSHHFDGLVAVENIHLYVKEKEFVAIIGPSGCGKSSILNIIAGLLVPSEGEVFVDNKAVTGIAGKVSYMNQKDLLLPWKKIIDNVALPYRVKGMKKKDAREKVKEFFNTFSLEGFEKHYPNQLSGGMRQRAALMRTYMCEKDMMLLDEPFGGLDAITKIQMQDWLKKVMNKLNRAVLLITHDIDEAIYLSDRIYVMSKRPGKIKAEISVQLDKSDRMRCTTSQEFNQLKGNIMELLQS